MPPFVGLHALAAVNSHRGFLLISFLALFSTPASAIISQPEALKDSGAVHVSIEMEVGEGQKLLQASSIKAQIEDRLEADGVPVIRDAQTLDDSGVFATGQRNPSQLNISIAMRSVAEPAGYIASVTVSQLQTAVIHPRLITIDGLAWQETWAWLVGLDTEIPAAMTATIVPLIDDFARDYVQANHPSAH